LHVVLVCGVLGLVFDGVMGWEHEWKHLHLDFFKTWLMYIG
jgi:hypothetical protein